MNHTHLLTILFGVCFIGPAWASSPSVYKCKDESGTTIYQAYPCPDRESEKVRIDPEPSGLGTVYHRTEAPEAIEDGENIGQTDSGSEKAISDVNERERLRAECVAETERYGENIRLQNFALRLCQGGLAAEEMKQCMDEGRTQNFTLPGWELHTQNCILRDSAKD